ncbi:hypothetical protein [Pseudarthrobacter oxydans]|uniref:hypothetical protein n=1 Tax=Pseudarthrobacter oxydans TaxID=1671 RepID=UPI003447FFB6
MMTDLIGGLWDDGSDAAVAKTGLDRAGLFEYSLFWGPSVVCLGAGGQSVQ